MSAWRDRLRPASFRGVEFHVEVGAQTGGRRLAPHEFPKRDDPYTEDMGRKGRSFPITAYLVGPDYLSARDALLDALEAEGPGLLVHPTLGEHEVACGPYACQERRERGGYCEIDLQFLEAGSPDPMTITDFGGGAIGDVLGAVGSAIEAAEAAIVDAVNGLVETAVGAAVGAAENAIGGLLSR